MIGFLIAFEKVWGRARIKQKETGLPEPEYKEEMGGFSVYFHKDIYTEENLKNMGLNQRQIKAVMYVKEKGKITNKEYQELCDTSERTATRDLMGLVDQDILEQVGITGKGTSYILKPPQSRQTAKHHKLFKNASKGFKRNMTKTI